MFAYVLILFDAADIILPERHTYLGINNSKIDINRRKINTYDPRHQQILRTYHAEQYIR